MAKIAILGFGTVGSGVGEVLHNNAERICSNAAQEIELKYILDTRPVTDARFVKYHITDFEIIENDPEVSVVVETIGGAGVALEFSRRALMAGKSVVTSNKELVAQHGHELLEIAQAKNVNYLFEASVGGGIPIIRPLTQCLAANELHEVYGILNGTTNYILTQMYKNGMSFDDALKQAQELGYAEGNPAADIEGADACRKICILADLSFGRHVYPAEVPMEGITNLSAVDVACAGELGYRIKLLGRALRTGEENITAYVAPHLVGEESMLAGIDGVFNGIVVRGNAIGDVMFYGQGAGKLPTASAVVADVIDAVKHEKSRKYLNWDNSSEGYVSDSKLVESRWYIRARSGDSETEVKLGTLGDARMENGCVVLITNLRMSENEIRTALEGVTVEAMLRVME